LARTPWAPGAPPLAAAARIVAAVASGESADAALAEVASGRAAVQAIALGSIRWYLRLLPAIERLLSRPTQVAEPLRSLLVCAAHQVEYSRNVPEATVHAAVDAARLLKAPRLTGLVNAVLRRFVAERAAIFASVDRSPASRTAHPKWFIERLTAAWPQQAEALLAANNAHPPMTLRVDLSRSDADAHRRTLQEQGIEAQAIQWEPSALTLTRPVGVSDLPGFADGVVSVQDAGAQLAARLLDVRGGMRVLDACASPGGKTGHLLEILRGEGEVTALDIDAQRAALIEDTLRRLQRTARIAIGDAREPSSFWDGRLFDRILVDAPCSSTGVIRRHPDIKLLRRRSDIATFAAAQREILAATAGLLRPGGRLVYSTCSVLPEENAAVIDAVLAAVPDLRGAGLAGVVLPPGAVLAGHGLQLLPGAEAGTDGFYYACLEKTTTGA
jgi:16S rRNA (cytosine967-C5)-methyltransferase